MGVPLTKEIGAEGRLSYRSKPWPIVNIGQAVDGSWFAMFVGVTRAVNIGTVRNRPSYRAAHDRLRDIVRSLRDELAELR